MNNWSKVRTTSAWSIATLQAIMIIVVFVVYVMK